MVIEAHNRKKFDVPDKMYRDVVKLKKARS